MSSAANTTEQHVDQPLSSDLEAESQVATAASSADRMASSADQMVSQCIPLSLELDEAEALHGWLLRPSSDGATALDEPLVSRVMSRLGLEINAARATATVRDELVQAGISAEHLSDEEIRALARRIADTAQAAIRA